MSVESRTNLNALPALDALERRSLEQARQARGDTGIEGSGQAELVAEGPQGPAVDEGEMMLATPVWGSDDSRDLPDSGFVSSGNMSQDLPDGTFGL